MGKRLLDFYKIKLSIFFTAVFHLFIFLPYFFSAPNLLKTSFSPWKNIRFKNIVDNLTSRLIGFCMRLSMLLFYILVQTLYMLVLPFVFVFYLFFLPILFTLSLFENTEPEKKQLSKNNFIKMHLTKPENLKKVEEWFEAYYKMYIHKLEWWQLQNLFSIPPLARDWATGYTPTLNEFTTDLCSSNYQLKIKYIVDREKEISQIGRALIKSDGANVMLVGETGVGKHTIIDAFAKKIFEGRSNPLLAYKRVLHLNLEKILAQFTDFQQSENFLEKLLQEAKDAKNIILLIENIDKYVISSSGNVDLTTSFEKFAKNTELQLIGITSPFFYQKFIFPNDRLAKLFEIVHVYEANTDEAEKILLNASISFEQKYRINISYETIRNIIEKSDFYITNIPFPEKALEILDGACVWMKEKNQGSILQPSVIDLVLSEKTHIQTTVSNEIKQKLVNLELLLNAKIIGQEQMVSELAGALRRAYILIGKRKKPLATFLFLGPTGVGKTETAKVISKILFDANHIIRFDMSLYQTKNDIPKLIGFSENNEPGLLTEKIRETPYGVLLLDEVEKADKDLVNIFLTVLDEGYFTDGFGKRVDCKNLIIIATSNASSDFSFSPEFLNRFDAVVTFNLLGKDAIIKIAQKMIASISDDIFKLHKVKFSVSQNFLESLAQKGYDEKYGARNMERLIRETIEEKVAKMILENKIKPGENLLFS